MNVTDHEKFNHYKPPYKYTPKFHCNCAQDVNLRPCPIPQKPHDCKREFDCKPKYEHPCNCGLLVYRKWWEMADVDLSVNGTLVSGMPIFIKDNTLRVINQDHSFFIPMEKIDYIRTTDGLCSSFQLSDGKLEK